MSATFRCGCGCGTQVKGIYCDAKRAALQRAAYEVAIERSARMADPEYQAKLQAARAAKAAPAEEGA